ncbi:F-box protein SKIP22-like [Pistacia vera]|uniref:F-box protein SKIP22-like n=1 Tax=Pistacia vera TaxID=55513 RepID=UPI00126310CA|nr:F-box protein SKIP22-like [Pistacia vera]
MKLRIRSLESRETRRLEIPSDCTLQQLKQILSQSISSFPSSLHLSLNRKDELIAPSPEASVESLGLTSGDLIYYSLNPSAFVSLQETATPELPQTLVPYQQESKPKEHAIAQDNENENPPARLDTQENPVVESIEIKGTGLNSEETMSTDHDFSLENQDISVDETHNVEGAPQSQEFPMDIDVDGKRTSEPCFLRRVLREEPGDGASAHKLVVIAVHAILLESGFVGLDLASGKKIDRLRLPSEWPSTAVTMSLWYTLPEILNNNANNVIESIVLKFQSLGHFVNVYGCLVRGDSGLHRVCLNESKFAPIIDLVWTQNGKLDGKDESKNSCPEMEVFEFWKMVKDGLALPLLIDLCEKTGLSLPACLMRLPTELKIKILECLPGVDIAKMGCVCSEIRYLASNNDLWEKKFVEEFGDQPYAPGICSWKGRFACYWDSNKKKQRVIPPWYPSVARPFHIPFIRDPYPLGIPPMIGGDHERLPSGIPFPFGQPSVPSHPPFLPFAGRRSPPFFRFAGRRSFSPNCNLGDT